MLYCQGCFADERTLFELGYSAESDSNPSTNVVNEEVTNSFPTPISVNLFQSTFSLLFHVFKQTYQMFTFSIVTMMRFELQSN